MNNQKIKIKILGSGSSIGSPLPGCFCETCVSKNPKNHRMRTSIFVEYEGLKILIDSGPDLKKQMVSNDLTHFDFVLYTHIHSDHICGINDLIISLINTKKPLEIFGNKELIDVLSKNFEYLFKPIRNPNLNNYCNSNDLEPKPTLIPNIIQNYDEIIFDAKKIRCFEQDHGKIKSIGYEFGNGKFVYSPDLKSLPEKTIDFLKSLKIELWLLPLTHINGNHSHISLEDLKKLVDIVNPTRAILIHMSHSLEYENLKELLKGTVIEPGFDSMIIEI
jgi:phosphoribosyl 1,2-cyclic phosphate phosphodiesterase